MTDLKATPLHDTHVSMGAKMVPFGGWDMPVQYTGIIQEHIATRTQAGLFDVSHMGEIFVEGDAKTLLEFLESTTCNSVASMKSGQVQYNAVLNEDAGLVDDVTVYKFSDNQFMICSNASNFESVYKHLCSLQRASSLSIRNDSKDWHQIALQGPKASAIFDAYLGQSLDRIGYYRFEELNLKGERVIVSRTGYTGEDGFEIYSSIPFGVDLWTKLLEFGKDKGLVPVGLGARDTLRLEAKYPLYGHELSANWNPIESGLGWIVKHKDIPYPQMEELLELKANGPDQKIIGIELTESGVLREHMPIFDKDNQSIGETTSGTHSPSLKKSIGLAMLKKEFQKEGTEIFVEIRGHKKKALVHPGSFIQGSVRKG